MGETGGRRAFHIVRGPLIRDHVMETARAIPTANNVAAAFEDPLRYVALAGVYKIRVGLKLPIFSPRGPGRTPSL